MFGWGTNNPGTVPIRLVAISRTEVLIFGDDEMVPASPDRTGVPFRVAPDV